MKIQLYSANSAKRILDLFEKTFSRKLTEEFWNWRCDTFGKSIRVVALENNESIGHVSGEVMPMKLDNNEEKALFLMMVMTHPDFQGKGISQKVLESIYNEAKNQNFKFAYGFSNEKAAQVHFKKTQMQNIGKIIEQKIQILDIDFIDTENNLVIEEIFEFDKKIDQIWESHKDKFHCIVPRTSTYLSWRFKNYPQKMYENYPSTTYFYYIIKKNNIPLTYFVLKKFGSDKGHLVDYFGLLNDKIFEKILNFSLTFCLNSNLKEFSFWTSFIIQKNFSHIFQKYKFETHISNTYFGITIFDQSMNNFLTEKNNWFFTMSDSDVF